MAPKNKASNAAKKAPKKTPKMAAKMTSKKTPEKAPEEAPLADLQTVPTEEDDQKNIFPFEKLPPELREMVYECLLVPGTVVDPSYPRAKLFKYNDVSFKGFLGQNGVAILRVNRLLYSEALPILYECNTFEVTSSASALDLRNHVKAIPGGPCGYRVLYSGEDDTDDFWATYQFPPMTYFRNLTNLSSVTVKVFHEDLHDWDGEDGVAERALGCINQAQFDSLSFVYDGPEVPGSELPFPLEEFPSRIKARIAKRVDVKFKKWPD